MSRNTSNDFTHFNMKKRTEKVFSVNYNDVDTSDLVDIHRYLMKELLECLLIKCLLDY